LPTGELTLHLLFDVDGIGLVSCRFGELLSVWRIVIGLVSCYRFGDLLSVWLVVIGLVICYRFG
jgi:hypothetical protein